MGVLEDVAYLEQSVGDLVVRYEQYFLGLEKREPIKLREEIERYIRRYNTAAIVNTMYKFRFNTMVAKFNSYKQYWTRTVQLIEEGKYSRDRFKMERHLAEGTSRLKPEPTAIAGNPDIESVYQHYLDARKQCNLPTDNISREAVFSLIESRREALKSKHRCADIEFRVVIENGAPKLKARAARPPAKP